MPIADRDEALAIARNQLIRDMQTKGKIMSKDNTAPVARLIQRSIEKENANIEALRAKAIDIQRDLDTAIERHASYVAGLKPLHAEWRLLETARPRADYDPKPVTPEQLRNAFESFLDIAIIWEPTPGRKVLFGDATVSDLTEALDRGAWEGNTGLLKVAIQVLEGSKANTIREIKTGKPSQRDDDYIPDRPATFVNGEY